MNPTIRNDNRDDSSLVNDMRTAPWFVRLVGSIVIIAISGLHVVPAVAAIQQEIEHAAIEGQENDISPEAEMSQTILSIMAELGKMELKLGDVEDEDSDEIIDTSEEDEALEELTEQLSELDEEVMTGFNEIGLMLAEKELPDVIVERHEAAVAKYQAEYSALMDGVEQIRETTNRKGRLRQTADLANRLGNMKHKRSQQHFDPNELPSRSLQPNKANKPKTTAMEFILADPVGDARHLMANVGDSLPTGDDAFSNPAWLSESDEVKLTQPIIDKAAELENDPVKIYHWVRNNIQWNPNWGAKQTAQLTMELQSGNAMDISSLAIALLRAANIPARYVHGTIDVPEDKFRNWAGGFEDIDSAIDYAASGGIPIGPVVSGGVATKVRMEHVWVEAAVDFVPSRAAINDQADSWIAIDPSFKLFEYLNGLDAIEISGLDLDKLTQDFIDSGTINESEGWVTGFDVSILETAQDQVQIAVEAQIAAGVPEATVNGIIGGRRTVLRELPMLGSMLPNSIIVIGTRYSSIPRALQQSITFALATNSIGELVDPMTFPWAEVNNRKITLSFGLATSDDVNTLLGFVPDEEVTDLAQLPDSFPAYLINVIPELRINGEIVMTGGIARLGNDIDFRFNPTIVGFGTVSNRYAVSAGSYLAVATVSNNVSPIILDELSARTREIVAAIQADDDGALELFPNQRVLGDVFYATVLAYYSEYADISEQYGVQLSANHTLAAGLGSIGIEPDLDFVFGVPRNFRSGGAVANLPIIRILGTDKKPLAPGYQTTTIPKYNFSVGLLSSSLEHSVLEHFFPESDLNKSASAFSTVKAFLIASDNGQRIYQLTPSNISSTLPNIHHDSETVSEIVQAVNSGKQVFTHTDSVAVQGVSGVGYIIFDQVTGDGAYKISSGVNGGRIKVSFLDNFLFKLSLFMDAAPKLTKVLKFAGYFEVLVNTIDILEGLVDLYNKCKDSISIATGFALLSIFVAFTALISLEIATLTWNPLAVFAINATVQIVSSRVLSSLNSSLCN